MDGVDCPMNQPAKKGKGPFPWDTKWNSHKFKGPGLRYLLSTCLKTGWIVGMHGPFPAGDWPDDKIYKEYIVPILAPG